MDVSSLGAGTPPAPGPGSGSATPAALLASPALAGAVEFIADQLGMSPSSVQAALRAGASVGDLAPPAGVGADALREQLAEHIQRARQSRGQTELPAAQLGRMLERAFGADRPSRAGSPPAPGGGVGAYGAAVATVASAERPQGGTISLLA